MADASILSRLNAITPAGAKYVRSFCLAVALRAAPLEDSDEDLSNWFGCAYEDFVSTLTGIDGDEQRAFPRNYQTTATDGKNLAERLHDSAPELLNFLAVGVSRLTVIGLTLSASDKELGNDLRKAIEALLDALGASEECPEGCDCGGDTDQALATVLAVALGEAGVSTSPSTVTSDAGAPRLVNPLTGR